MSPLRKRPAVSRATVAASRKENSPSQTPAMATKALHALLCKAAKCSKKVSKVSKEESKAALVVYT